MPVHKERHNLVPPGPTWPQDEMLPNLIESLQKRVEPLTAGRAGATVFLACDDQQDHTHGAAIMFRTLTLDVHLAMGQEIESSSEHSLHRR